MLRDRMKETVCVRERERERESEEREREKMRETEGERCHDRERLCTYFSDKSINIIRMKYICNLSTSWFLN